MMYDRLLILYDSAIVPFSSIFLKDSSSIPEDSKYRLAFPFFSPVSFARVVSPNFFDAAVPQLAVSFQFNVMREKKNNGPTQNDSHIYLYIRPWETMVYKIEKNSGETLKIFKMVLQNTLIDT